MISTKNDCVHKVNGESCVKVVNQINKSKYICFCDICKKEFILKRKQIPVDAMWVLEN